MSNPVPFPRIGPRGLVVAAVAVAIVLLVFYYREALTPRSAQLNAMLRDDPVVAAFPYRPRVVSFLGGVVSVTRPYSDASGPAAFLAHIDPSLRNLPPDAPAVRAAEQALRDFEMHVFALLVDQPDVDSLTWWLDRAWYSRNRVPLPEDEGRP